MLQIQLGYIWYQAYILTVREDYHIGLLIKIWFCKSDFMTIEKTLMIPVDTI